ncbi:unnamed protein product [Darwinula stevensoni]|uniref:Uncharacterized protein n=1 Tax=Darwinula stevensoni TaxID=69355 RepID=A0A7R9A633_9CRUS|nr:unnamed protein product [Darwinula stevensoni]CAG0887912.1 unnamed protein product [Darwinula stevensoni]
MGAHVGITCIFLLSLLQWSSVDAECNVTFTEPWGSFSSPNYPNDYNNNELCWYYIEVIPDGLVYVNFLDFQLQWDPTCNYDSLAIAQYANQMTQVLCGQFGSFSTDFEADFYQITFQTDSILTYSGFSAEFWTLMPLKCEEGWEEFQLGCYLFADDRKTATEAQRECEGVGANLASIHREEEFIFIGEHALSSPLWIGLQTEDSQRKWVDGTSYDYELSNLNFLSDDGFAYTWVDQWVMGNCARSEPSSRRSLGEDCEYAVLDTKGDYSKEGRFPFVCKKDRPRTILKGD